MKYVKLFKTVDDKLSDIGFKKIKENKYGVKYEKYDEQYKFIHCVVLSHKASGHHILQSYDRDLMDTIKVGNTCVGLTGYELSLFLKKMKKIGLYSK